MMQNIRRLTLSALALAACGAPPRQVALHPQVHRGPALSDRPGKVLALSASCGSVEAPCPDEYIETVDGIVRSSLEFVGYTLVDPESLRNQTRQRHETHEREVETTESHHRSTTRRTLDFDDHHHSAHASRRERRTSTILLDGPGFSDLSVRERKEVLREAGTSSIVSARIVVGAVRGVWTLEQSVEVTVRLSVGEAGAMAWAARCRASTHQFGSINAALEEATRCAVYGGTGS